MRTDTERLDWILAALDSGNGEPLERLQAAYTLELRGRTAMDAAMGAKLVEPGEPMPELTALDLAVAELGRIRNVKGFSEEHDDNDLGSHDLAYASATYLIPDEGRREGTRACPDTWPWHPKYWKPSPDDRKRELTKGIALALCELDRLIRAERRAEIEACPGSPESRAGVEAACKPCGCPCEPNGADGLRCPDSNGRLLCDDRPKAPREFKVGDRVRVTGGTEFQDVKVGALGTVREAGSSCPWIEFDEPTGFPHAVNGLGIPAGYADAVRLRNLEHVDG